MMRGLSLWQPWASLVAAGLKRYETRSWGTTYRGPLVICAAKRWNAQLFDDAEDLADALVDLGVGWWGRMAPFCTGPAKRPYPLGVAVALVELTACDLMTRESIAGMPPAERAVGDWRVGRWAWRLERVRPILPPEPIVGARGVFDVADEAAKRITTSAEGAERKER